MLLRTRLSGFIKLYPESRLSHTSFDVPLAQSFTVAVGLPPCLPLPGVQVNQRGFFYAYTIP